MALKRAVLEKPMKIGLTSESVQGASLSLQGVHDIHSGDGLPLGVLGVGDGVTDNILEEHLEDSTGLLVDEPRDTLHTSSAGQTPDGRLRDTLDVVAKHLPMAFSATLSQSFSSFATARHVALSISNAVVMQHRGEKALYTRAAESTVEHVPAS